MNRNKNVTLIKKDIAILLAMSFLFVYSCIIPAWS